ncbi:hypothetical protein K491DRAFT_698093 [Lophiostoma macrostomum CBS 122681]|uniref:Uncharacterized protein n=1 Tax=Lophiostoma macrostomum CBS 122681 TaxID=1314788 RepID=A0A6A6SSA2_9PLEO|nr:hypothetical protein K491DRAFT_698093 [Lophiostoma macrostomum CBS 122681]
MLTSRRPSASTHHRAIEPLPSRPTATADFRDIRWNACAIEVQRATELMSDSRCLAAMPHNAATEPAISTATTTA